MAGKIDLGDMHPFSYYAGGNADSECLKMMYDAALMAERGRDDAIDRKTDKSGNPNCRYIDPAGMNGDENARRELFLEIKGAMLENQFLIPGAASPLAWTDKSGRKHETELVIWISPKDMKANDLDMAKGMRLLGEKLKEARERLESAPCEKAKGPKM